MIKGLLFAGLIGALSILGWAKNHEIIAPTNSTSTKTFQLKPDSAENNFTIPAGDYTYTIDHGGKKRLWIAHVPASYTGKKPTPMILNFHGAGGNAESAMNSTQMNLHSDKEGYIVVYPEGTGKKVLGKLLAYWNVEKYMGRNTDVSGVDDLGFVSAIIDDMSKKFNIDSKRIFATGLSRGGMMTYYLACQPNSKIAAFAPVSTNFVNDEATCQPGRPVSIIHFHGTADRVLPYKGGLSDPTLPEALSNNVSYLSAPASVTVFAKKNGCSDSPKIVYTKGKASCAGYLSCQDSSEVILCTLTDAGHTWPGGQHDLNLEAWKKIVGSINYDLPANETMWEFFKRHPLN